MVNLDKWEEIGYGDIEAGDRLRVITRQGSVVNDTQGVAHNHTWNGWVAENAVKFLNHPDYFKPVEGGSRTIYRRKPKPFTFPDNQLAVIKGVRIGYDTVVIWFAKTGSGWVHQSGSEYTEDMIRQYFHNFTVEFEGVK
jgi:hypothetical protein